MAPDDQVQALQQQITAWRAQFRQANGGRDPQAADLTPDIKAKMIKLREARSAGAQQAQPAVPPPQVADENCNRSNQGGAALLAVPKASSSHQQRSRGPQPCGSEEAEEVGSDTECPVQLPLGMPAALPGAMPVMYASAATAGLLVPGAVPDERSFFRRGEAPPRAAPASRRGPAGARHSTALRTASTVGAAGGSRSQQQGPDATQLGSSYSSAVVPAVAHMHVHERAGEADGDQRAGAASAGPEAVAASMSSPAAQAATTSVPANTEQHRQQQQEQQEQHAAAVPPSRKRGAAAGPAFLGRRAVVARLERSTASPKTTAAEAPAAATRVAGGGAAACLSLEAGPSSRAAATAGESRQQAQRSVPSSSGAPEAVAGAVPAAATAEEQPLGAASHKREETAVPAATASAPAPAVQASSSRQAGAPALAARPATAAGAAAAAAGPASNVVTSRTAEGLNVVYVKRQAGPADGGSGSSRAGKSKPNQGWGNNFVRYDMKKGKGSTSYKSSRHSYKKKRRGGGGGRGWGRGGGPSRLRQVGDGADYLEGWADPKLKCFKCGGAGHFAKDCTEQAKGGMVELAGSGSESEEGGMTRAQELAALGLTNAAAMQRPQQQPRRAAAPAAAQQPGSASGGPGQLPAAGTGPDGAAPASSGGSSCGIAVPERFAAAAADPTEEALLGVLGEVFGFPAFRGLQLPTIQRVLAGESVLSIMPTGMGKSLCYQLPALLLPGVTLVVSPLIALMHDQRASLPPQFSSAVLWSGQSKAEALQVLADVKAGQIKVLFVSPERLGNPHLLDALQPHMPLPLVVVDEAHCVAEWGHSFRPAYFRLGWALQHRVHARSVLALTATATRATEAAVLSVLRIPPSAVLRDSVVRSNLRLHVVRKQAGASSHSTWDDIVRLFQGSTAPLAAVRSAIVYCAYKDDADKLAQRLNAHGVRAAAYHAGRHLRDRAAVESDFVCGRVRVVVATVAFGMGINVRSVGAVVHATMPRSLEEYVQQVGRAGRDGSEASCYAFLSDSDFVKLRSLAFSGLLERATLAAFLEVVFAEEEQQGRQQKQKQKHAKGAGRKRKRSAAAAAEPSSDEEEANAEPPQPEPTAAAAAAAAGGDDAAQADTLPEDAVDSSMAAPEAEGSEEAQREQQEQQQEEQAPPQRRFGVLSSRKLSTQLDMREDSMETVLSYLEADASGWVRMLPNTSVSVRVSFYAGTAQQLAPAHPIVQVMLQVCPNPRKGIYNVHLGKLATAAQRPPGLLLQELRDMAAASLIAFELSKEEGPAYEILRTPPDLPQLAEEVHTRRSSVLCCQVRRLDTAYRAFAAAAGPAAGAAAGAAAAEPSGSAQQQQQEAVLRQAIAAYFEQPEAQQPGPQQQQQQQQQPAQGAADGGGGSASAGSSNGDLGAGAGLLQQLDLSSLPLKPATPALLHAARAILRKNAEQKGGPLSALGLARVLHGLSSPAAPAKVWCKLMGSFWGCHAASDFGVVLRAAEIACRDNAQ